MIAADIDSDIVTDTEDIDDTPLVRLKFARDKEKQHESELDYDIPPKLMFLLYQISDLSKGTNPIPLVANNDKETPIDWNWNDGEAKLL